MIISIDGTAVKYFGSKIHVVYGNNDKTGEDPGHGETKPLHLIDRKYRPIMAVRSKRSKQSVSDTEASWRAIT